MGTQLIRADFASIQTQPPLHFISLTLSYDGLPEKGLANDGQVDGIIWDAVAHL